MPSPRGVSAMAGLLCRLLLLCLAAAGTNASLVLDEVRRSLDLSTHLAKISAELSLANAPGGAAASAFLLALEPGLEPRLAHLGVQVSVGSRHRAPRPGGPRALAGLALEGTRRHCLALSAAPGFCRRPGMRGVWRGTRAEVGSLGVDEAGDSRRHGWAEVAASTAGAGLAAPGSAGAGGPAVTPRRVGGAVGQYF